MHELPAFVFQVLMSSNNIPPASAGRYAGMAQVWKFGYGSNLGPEFLRTKKGLNPLDAKPSILQGWQLSFPKGKVFPLSPSPLQQNGNWVVLI